MNHRLFLTTATILSASVALSSGCEDKKPQAPTSTGANAPKPAHTDHKHADEHDGAAIQLGSSKIGTFDVKASRGEGPIAAGKEAPIDVTVTPAAASAAAKAASVRFWIGTEDAKGSVKAKGELEDPKNPSLWHAHVEIPSPIPTGAKLWVEIEDDKGQKHVGGFELKA